MNYEANGEVLVTDLSDELALLDPRTSRMYTLNAVGRTVWQALSGDGMGEDQLVQVVTEAFDVEADQARMDIRTLLADLKREGLVRPA
ncbi:MULTISPECIES: PqqD family protein [unclassified Deinococcus]|uniref:PqqD family protein n=1 Tax=unclassified Deinococcus TaxID=2623546 RepID=UPI001C3089CA|nr:MULTISPECIES: PqqD family protein [unclassified Deinococcus]MDK2014343.1 PqqD family protein [Deinococcus sp. 43]